MRKVIFVKFSKDIGEPIFNFEKYIFVSVLFFVFSSFLSNAQNTLGPDVAICKGDAVVLSSLNPVVLSPTGKEWWKSSGDGTFTPVSGLSYNYGIATHYNPGAVDISNGYVVISLYSNDVLQASVTVYIQDDVLFACNDKVTVPLDFHCEYEVSPPVVLEGEDETIPYNLYDIELRDESGNLIPDNIVSVDHIGQNISYYISHSCSYNACGGVISVQDNYRPIISCGNDTITCKISLTPEDSLGFPVDTSLFPLANIVKDYDNNNYIVEGWDGCGDVTLSYIDEVKSFKCSENLVFQEQIVRKWKAVDASGNRARCTDTIRVERIKAGDVKMPPNWDDTDTVALQCDGIWKESALANGYPSPDITGFPEVWGCNIEYNYSDEHFDGCGSTFDIIRKWTIIDWCNPDNIVYHSQVIKIVDTVPPVFDSNDDTLLVSSDPYYCGSQLCKLKVPTVSDNSNSSQLFVNVYNEDGVEFTVQKSDADYFVNDLPFGFYKVKWSAVDDCGNIGNCLSHFEIIDNQSPYAVCGEHHVVNLTSNGEARLYPASIDDGSFDNCGIDTMKIRKMTHDCNPSYFEFGEYIGFCCEEIGQKIMVALQITDFAGNSNTCMVEVTVNDKLPPQISCPPDIHVSCDYYYNSDDLSSYFGTVREGRSLVKDIYIYDDYNKGFVGKDGYAYDNCSVQVSEKADFDINNCNVGTITRTFTAKDNGGRVNRCYQKITITNSSPFTSDLITWPENKTFYGCSSIDADTSITGVPTFRDGACSLVSTSYSDQLFSVEGDACKKIIRTWTVRDWCQSDDIKWTHRQHIELFNKEAPKFTGNCEDREVCVYGECRGQVKLTATAEDDCTPSADLVWNWKLDKDNDGTYDDFGEGNNFSKIMDEGDNRIVWTVEDKCGNISNCSYVFTVKDCKKPTPLCIENLSTAVMNTSGMVTVKAKDFNHFSYDNCTNSNYGDCSCETDLKFSFSKDVKDTLYNITCDSIYDGVERIFNLRMWVTDNAGNQDYCSVKLKVSDNNNVCGDNEESGKFSLSGLFSKWSDNSPVPGISVELSNPNIEEQLEFHTDDNGKFEFSDLSQGSSYSVIPKDDKSNCLEGLSTLDVVKIQKHILGIQKFKSPYQYIAADVNKNKRITAADILYIRKLILGIIDDFNNKPCWEYVDAEQELTTKTPYYFDNTITVSGISDNLNDVDFKVVKIGDINDSHSLNQLTGGLLYRDNTKLELVVDDRTFLDGESFDVPIYSRSNADIEGMQFTINFNVDNMSYEGFSGGQLELNDSNFGVNKVNQGILTFSWNTIGAKYFSKDNPLFTLKFVSNQKASVLQDFSINSDVTKALSIVDDKEVGIVLNYRGNDVSEFFVYQNTPNPFTNSTAIRFVLPEAQDVSIEVFDINGNLLLSENRYFKKGMNSFEISKSKLSTSGVYYYSVKIAESKITKKMILID